MGQKGAVVKMMGQKWRRGQNDGSEESGGQKDGPEVTVVPNNGRVLCVGHTAHDRYTAQPLTTVGYGRLRSLKHDRY